MAGKNFRVLSVTNRIADVYGFNSNHGCQDSVPIVTAATAYDSPTTGETYILIFNEVLWYGNKLDHSLINPNQLRHFGVHYWDNPYDHGKRVVYETW